MRSIIAYFIRYPVWTNVLMGGTLLFGIMSMLAMKSSFFPEREPRIITVMVPFPGASPEEVEEGVILKIEENLDGLEGIERIISTASENVGNVTVEILEGYELDDVLTEVKNAVDRISSFPVDAERPVVSLQKFRSRSVSMVLHGKADLYNLKFIAENLRDELLIHPMISQVVIDGVPALEFSIEVSEANLRRYGLSFSEIANAVRAFNVNISGGKFETRDEEILIRAYGRNYFARELENIPVRGDQGGTIIFLKDIATIRERWEDSPERTYYNGSPAIVLTVNHTLDEDILDVRQATLEVMEAFNDRNEEVKVTILNDQTVPLRQRLDLLVENGILGLLLVLVVLGFFMNLRVSFWCALGIPISFAGMFLVAKFVGITVNVISLFGMIIVVGILVDDAIVVAEKVYYYYERGMPALKAAVTGTMEVLVPVFTSIATTVVAFMPFFFLLGPMDFIWQMALVVISSLIFSLIEAFLILPAHLAHSKALDANRNIPPLRQKIENIIHIMTNTVYARTLKLALDYKWVTVTVPIVGVFLVIGMLRGGIIGFTQFPYIDRDELIVSVALVNGRQEAVTDSVLQTIEKKVWEVNEEFKAGRPDSLDVVEAVIRQLGTSQIGESGSHTGQVQIQLLNGEVRDMDSFIIANRIREKVGTIPEAQKTSFAPNSFFGKEISVSFLGQDINQLNRARDLLLAEMENMPNIKDITDSNQEGRRELNIRLKPRAYALGLTLQDVAGQVRQGFFGQEVQRIQRGRDEIRVWVRYREDDRSALGFLNQMRIRTPDGREYPFSTLAEYDIERGITTIRRLDKLREITVEAVRADVTEDLPPILTNIQEVVVPRILHEVQNVQVSFEGQSRGFKKFATSMRTAFPIAMLGMLIILFLVFRSYLQGLMIFLLIPFGVMCAILGHWVQGIAVTVLSIYGIIALSGIIINDSIVLVDQINRFLREGQNIYDAVFNGAVTRLRPILLTTLTTAVGLGPIIFETSRQAKFLIPMAVSVAYGIMFGTFILLVMLPAQFLVLNRLRFWWAKVTGRNPESYESVEPAVRELKDAVIEH